MRGLNIGFTKDGLSEITGAERPSLDPSLKKGADIRETIEKLHDPPISDWQKEFVSDRIDGLLLLTGPSRSIIRFYCNDLLDCSAPRSRWCIPKSATRGPARI